MILSSTINVTKSQLKLISFFINPPLRIGKNHEKNPVFYDPTQARLNKVLKVKLFSLAFYAAFLFFNGIQHLRNPTLQMGEKVLIALFSFGIPVLLLAIVTSWYGNPKDFAILLNMLVANERRIFDAGEKEYGRILSYGKFLKFALRALGLYGSVLLQIFMLLLLLAKAGKPPFLGSLIPGTLRNDVGDTL